MPLVYEKCCQWCVISVFHRVYWRQVPVGKKSKKKKKKGSSSRQPRRRAATEDFWQTHEEEDAYNGPPVNVIYNTSQ